MQTFSSVRRNSTDKKYLKNIILSICCIVYVCITDIFYLLPPLFGVIYILSQEYYEQHEYGAFYILVPYFIFFEASKGLLFLSSILFIVFSFKIVLPKFRRLFGYSKIFIPLFIFYAYFGYFAFLYLFSYLFDYPSPTFSFILVFYSIIESMLIWIFLWIFV
ncbi:MULTISPECIES: hypothetical protein [Helicobacter]|uniref:Uncharacterized protein n=1 Tax=Helicobacter ibis TaxID=2962633 RepID=A0ABT4VEM5_9HELI|nr:MULTISPECIES: hypothetical protein [Helicobacter]MDA3967397.1 hypothetical protein [Helicobacter sp. WB40]MDA3969159.1 hypothetical protein [Helicobacter ibis]